MSEWREPPVTLDARVAPPALCVDETDVKVCPKTAKLNEIQPTTEQGQ